MHSAENLLNRHVSVPFGELRLPGMVVEDDVPEYVGVLLDVVSPVMAGVTTYFLREGIEPTGRR